MSSNVKRKMYQKGRVKWPHLLVWSVTAILWSMQASAFLINYQSQLNLGLLPNGYNVAASNSAGNQQLQQQQQQQQQSQPQQPPDLSQYNPGDQAGPQQQDHYASQGLLPFSGTSNHIQYANRNNNNQQQQQATSGISERETGPIFRFQGSALNSSTVKLVWSLESGYTADSFKIKYGPIPDHEVFTLTLNGSTRESTISSLTPDTLYQFTLWGYSGETSGHVWHPRIQAIKTPKLTEQAQTVRQLVEDGSITPLGIKAEAKSNQSIQLSWTEQERPLNVQNLKRVNIIRYYVVNNTQNNQQQLEAQSAVGHTGNSSSSIKYHTLNVTDVPNSRIIIQRLKPATEYAFAVKTAYVSPDSRRATLRHSGFSMDTSAKTFDLEPSAPRNFSIQSMLTREETQAGQTIPKLELTWAPPESPNGQLRGYLILYAHEPNLVDEKWSKILVNDSAINNWYVANLRPGASYYFKMRAFNQRGQSPDTETRLFIAPPPQQDRMAAPIPANNILMMIVLCLIALLFVMFLVVSLLFCRSRNSSSSKSRRKGSLRLDRKAASNHDSDGASTKLTGAFASSQSSTVAGRMGTLARRSRLPQNDNKGEPDFWISAIDQQQQAIAAAAANNSEIKSNISEKSNSDINMAAMVSIQRDSPQQFTTQTTQLAPILPEYRFASNGQQIASEQQLMQQFQQQQSHYHTGHQQFAGSLGFDQMDNATASALMTLSKRQQQQLQKYQIQFASTTGANLNQAPSPHQQPPPPPPLNIEQQQQQNQTLYGTHNNHAGNHLNNTRSLRIHRPTLYDPVSGSFVQQDTPPNYDSHLNSMLNGVHHQLQSFNNQPNNNVVTSGSNTLQFHSHPHQTSTLMSRRSTNTLRSFRSSNGGSGLYGQLGGQFAAPPVPPTSGSGGGPPHLLQNHQAVINQLNQSTYPSLPLKHVSTVKPQIMSSLEDQIEMELAEKQAELSQQQQQQQQHHQQQT